MVSLTVRFLLFPFWGLWDQRLMNYLLEADKEQHIAVHWKNLPLIIAKTGDKTNLPKRLTPDMTLVKAERTDRVHLKNDKRNTKVYVYRLF